MEILDTLALNGPNIWANFPVVEALVDLGAFEERPSNVIPGFTERLTRWLPGLVEHRCSVGQRGGFIRRLEDGTWLGHVLEHVSLELHSLAHLPAGYGRARETGEHGVYRVVIECASPELGRACLAEGRSLVLSAAIDRAFDVDAAVRRLAAVADRTCLGPGTRAIVAAARALGVPAIRLTDGNLVQLGHGRSQRRIWTAETDRTSAVAGAIAQDKQLTRRLLESVGVPVPAGREVKDPAGAWASAQDLGLPVVVKPSDGNHGRGVSIALSERDAIEAAFAYAACEGAAVVVERFVPGMQYRVLVVGDRAIAAACGQPDEVVGDGESTIRQLVDRANLDIQRAEDSARLLSTLVLDGISLQLLQRQGLDASSIPEKGRTVVLHHNGDLTVDVTSRMHREVAARCALAAKTVGLDIAGIDLIAKDIGQPLESQGGAVIEVNASPALVMHLSPLAGEPRPVAEAIVDTLFSGAQTGHVPIVAVSGGIGRSEVACAIASMLENAGRSVALAGALGLRSEGRMIDTSDSSTASAARRALMNPYVDAAVLEVSEGSVLAEGLGFDRCDVAVVMATPERETFGGRFRWGNESVHKAVRAPVDIVVPEGAAVLAADDLAVARMAEKCAGEVILFGSATTPPLMLHVEKGGRAVVVEGDALTLVHGAHRDRIDTGRLPVELRGDVRAAVAAVGVLLGF